MELNLPKKESGPYSLKISISKPFAAEMTGSLQRQEEQVRREILKVLLLVLLLMQVYQGTLRP